MIKGFVSKVRDRRWMPKGMKPPVQRTSVEKRSDSGQPDQSTATGSRPTPPWKDGSAPWQRLLEEQPDSVTNPVPHRLDDPDARYFVARAMTMSMVHAYQGQAD